MIHLKISLYFLQCCLFNGPSRASLSKRSLLSRLPRICTPVGLSVPSSKRIAFATLAIAMRTWRAMCRSHTPIHCQRAGRCPWMNGESSRVWNRLDHSSCALVLLFCRAGNSLSGLRMQDCCASVLRISVAERPLYSSVWNCLGHSCKFAHIRFVHACPQFANVRDASWCGVVCALCIDVFLSLQYCGVCRHLYRHQC